jgi:hypothetical protein
LPEWGDLQCTWGRALLCVSWGLLWHELRVLRFRLRFQSLPVWRRVRALGWGRLSLQLSVWHDGKVLWTGRQQRVRQ